MFIRCLSAILLAGLMATPAWAEQKTATDKVVDTFMALDGDDSGTVSSDEYKAMVEKRANERFSQMDANGDGEVSADEYRAFWVKEKAKWYRLKR
ncbi:EF-hand domain-containing protein [Mariprofundus ferrooxydans]|uniref:EF-hand domain-containing protein n=1 Tax=Mariprofundus ferrooxydans TaxID=314344 RepID=UPI00036D392D|nr:EF-hand domain-containing protein [Mariprofundus ferrooxydans]